MTSREKKRLRRLCCVHEVSHAVACLCGGIRFRGIQIYNPGEEPDVLHDGKSVGVSGGRVEIIGEWTLSESAEDMIIMYLAGPASTRKLTHKSWFFVNAVGSGSGDNEQAAQIANLRYGEKMGQAYMEKCERLACRLVANHWQTILRIAEVLSECSYLSYAEFLELYQVSNTQTVAG